MFSRQIITAALLERGAAPVVTDFSLMKNAASADTANHDNQHHQGAEDGA